MPSRRTFSVAVFARHADRILLIRHRRLQTWLPVGGEIEPGETPLEAARRELLEETGLHGHFVEVDRVDGAPAGLIGYEEHPAGSKGLHMNFAFVADVPTAEVVGNGEFDAHAWVAHADALECPVNVRQLLHVALHAGAPALVALAREWLRRFNARDLEGLLALYDDDAVHTSPRLREHQPETLGLIKGKEALWSWWKEAMDRLPGLHYAEQHLTAGGDRVFMEYLRTNPGDPPLLVAECLVVRRGRIVASHVFHG